VVLIDEQGALVDGDRILALCALEMHRAGALRQGTVVGTVMSNLGLEIALRGKQIELLRTGVGDRYVVEAMRREKLNLGGEQSGHVVFLDHNTTGDGMLTALQVLALMRRGDRPLSEVAAVMEPLPQVLRSERVRERLPFDEVPAIRAAIAAAEAQLGERGRVLVRYSGTELLARVMVEGEERARIESLADEICGEIRRHLGEVSE
jgi:phosphoglucosamine mutase